MRVAIMGTGAVGGYYGALLARAGHDVVFVARGAQLEALRARGLRIVGDEEDFTLHPLTVVANPAQGGVVDVVLLCVKAYDVENAARACLPMLGRSSYVLTLQNGVESVDIVSGIVGTQRVLGGATYVVASLEAPGVVRRTGRWA